jgi:hypothetical protein
MNLNDDKAYYWTVRATDNNTAGTWAIDTLMFRTYHPQPIEPFALLQPADGAVLNPGVTLFRWEEAVDPDPGDPVNCTLWFVQGDDSIGYEIGNRTSMLVLPDTITILIPYLSATWYVSAQSSSPYCVLSSEERFTFVVPSAVEGEFQGGIPSEFRLYPPFPNPFNEVVFINFDLPEKCPVNLAIYNIRGQKVCLLTDGINEPGNHTLNFDADGLSSGVFIVQLQAGNFRSIQKVVLLK